MPRYDRIDACQRSVEQRTRPNPLETRKNPTQLLKRRFQVPKKIQVRAPIAGGYDLTQRDLEILQEIIRTHTLSGEPVSSRAVSKLSSHHLSAASIRNIMADLEDCGLLVQPHTSAGRVPTQAAYRLYVESLMQRTEVPASQRRYIEDHLIEAASDNDVLMHVVTHLLSELSEQVGIVLTPTVEDTVVKSIDFVSIGEGRVLCVLVSTSGFIDHLVIEVKEDMGREELVRISNYLNDHFAGMHLRQIRDRLLALMAEERAHVDLLLAHAIELARRALSGTQPPGVLVEGTSSLLVKPELSNLSQVRKVLDTFDDKARLVTLLNTCLTSDGVRVFIGEDTDVTSELEFSLVATTYGVGERSLGRLGIMGPSRMEYSRIVPLVQYLGKTLSRALTESAQEHT